VVSDTARPKKKKRRKKKKTVRLLESRAAYGVVADVEQRGLHAGLVDQLAATS
jgi:hypothetical protein